MATKRLNRTEGERNEIPSANRQMLLNAFIGHLTKTAIALTALMLPIHKFIRDSVEHSFGCDMSKQKSKALQIVDVSFEINELVFTKITKGSRPWPSRIIEIHNERIRVYFFGDNGRV